MLGTGIEQGASLLAEGRCTHNRLQLVPAPTQGCSPTGPRQLAPSQAVAGRPLVCESGEHATLSRRCSVRVHSPDLACLLKVVAPSAAYSSYLLHQGCCWTDHGASPHTGGGRPAPDVCESGDHVTLSRRCSVRVSSKVLACLLKVVAPRTAYSSYLLPPRGALRRGHANSPLTGGGRPAPDV